jgi:RNA polymerase sigma factor (sigma-70 family)
VFEHHYRELLNFLARKLNDRDSAADLAQESYARVLTLQQSGEAIADPRALLYRVARNLVVDRHRRSVIRGETARIDDEENTDEAGVLAAPSAWEPEAAAMSAQGVDAMLATIDTLPPRCREAFVLHKFDGLSHAEVAQRMGISRKMVEQHVKNALIACRRCRNQIGGARDASLPARAGKGDPE